MTKPNINNRAINTPEKQKHAGGRPVKFSTEQREQFINSIRSGSSKKAASEESGITYQTSFLWMRRGMEEEDFSEDQRTEYYWFYQDVLKAEQEWKSQNVKKHIILAREMRASV